MGITTMSPMNDPFQTSGAFGNQNRRSSNQSQLIQDFICNFITTQQQTFSTQARLPLDTSNFLAPFISASSSSSPLRSNNSPLSLPLQELLLQRQRPQELLLSSLLSPTSSHSPSNSVSGFPDVDLVQLLTRQNNLNFGVQRQRPDSSTLHFFKRNHSNLSDKSTVSDVTITQNLEVSNKLKPEPVILGCPPAGQRIKGKLYFVKNCIKRWDGKRFAKCCEVDSCTRLAQGPTSFCKSHGGGTRCKIADCLRPARGGFNYCQEHCESQQNQPASTKRTRDEYDEESRASSPISKQDENFAEEEDNCKITPSKPDVEDPMLRAICLARKAARTPERLSPSSQ